MKTDTRKLYQFVNYFDVWGNQKDGFEVNNLCTEPIFIRAEYLTLDACIKALKKAGFIKKTTRKSQIEETSFDADYLDMEEKKTGCPLGRFELHHYLPSETRNPTVYTPRRNKE